MNIEMAELSMQLDTKPWYKQFWPWFLISIPGLTVVAGVITIYLAASTSDGLVKDEYYKDGLAINQSLERDRLALKLGIKADVLISPEGNRVELRLQSEDMPESMHLKLMHATLANLDQEIVLPHIGGGIYRGDMTALKAGKWYVDIGPESREWRLTGQFPDTNLKYLRLNH